MRVRRDMWFINEVSKMFPSQGWATEEMAAISDLVDGKDCKAE